MKRLIQGYVINFGMMFTFAMIMCAVFLSAFPFLSAFILWDVSRLAIGWDAFYFFMRVSIATAVIIALWYTFSKEGKAAAKEYAEGK